MHVVFTYDTESVGECVPKLQKVWEVHKRHAAPLSAFVVGRVAERDGAQLRELVDDGRELWDVNSHTYSHTRVVRKIPWSKPQPPRRLIEHEIVRGAEVVRDMFEVPCRGTRAAGGVSAGYRGHPDNLDAMAQAGCVWDSSFARSIENETNPCDPYGPFSYEADGHPEMVELPVHGWPDCTVKGAAGPVLGERYDRYTQYIVGWPSPWAYPDGFVETPQQEFEVHRQTIDVMAATGLPFCCLGFHPWCLVREQDPAADVIDLLLSYCKEQGHPISTMDAEAERCLEDRTLLSPAPAVPASREMSFDAGSVFA